MTTTESYLPLSLFLPENLPSEDEMQKGIEECTANVSCTAEPFRTTDALAQYGTSEMPRYDNQFRSFEAALEAGEGNCLTVAALTVLAGKLVEDTVCIPTIETYRDDTEGDNKSLHAFTTVLTSAGDVIRCENLVGSSYFGRWSVIHPSTRLERFVLSNPELLTIEGVVQVREDDAGVVTILTGHESRQRHTASTLAAFTLFNGEEGLKSYLSTIEKISARKQNRTADTFPAQLIPRL